jgi:DNA-binding LacI/PurR family transcriptional regulator
VLARPTMKDVAQEAGVSAMTVSRVVNADPGVMPETAVKVHRAIRKLGYQRDDLARQLRRTGQLTQTIALLLDNVADPFMASLASAAEDVARRHGSVVLIGSSRDDLRREREVVSAFTARRVDGLILIPVSGSHRFLRNAMATGTRVVCADRSATGLDLDTVVIDNRGSAQEAMAHLIAHGHRRIAYLGDRLDIWTIQERYAGYRAALHSAGISEDPAIVGHGLRLPEDAAQALRSMLASLDPPTAVLASNGIVGLGVRAALPPQVALVSLDDFFLAAQLDPAVTVVAQNPAAMGTTAAGLLFARIHGDTSPPRTVVLPTQLIPRGSGEVPGPHLR